MSTDGWRYAAASVGGTSHTQNGTPCQDSNECRVISLATGDTVLLATASDGAGSASEAADGSRLACTYFSHAVGDFLQTEGSISDVTAEKASEWVTGFQQRITEVAERNGLSSRDYASTLLVAAVAESAAFFFQIGDGCIVIRRKGESVYHAVFWPERGDYENVTFFVTQPDATQHVQFGKDLALICEVAVFTDGLQRLALHFGTKTAHNPFFHSIFPSLRRLTPGESSGLSNSLAAFLDSPSVNERTDDDKTLILATKVAADDEA